MRQNTKPIVILSRPRSGSSFLARTLLNSGFMSLPSRSKITISPSKMNPEGYFEDVLFALLNDQIIRIRFNPRSSFLYLRSSDFYHHGRTTERFEYDLTPSSVEIAPDFVRRMRHYTGQDWDIWGLTRMSPGSKWFRCYSQAGVENGKGVKRAIRDFRNEIKKAGQCSINNRTVIKDPRLALTLQAFDVDVDVIVLERESSQVESSMRRHYGQRMFTENVFEGYDWVSNHFNYRILPQQFCEYDAVFEKALMEATLGRHTLRLSLTDIENGEWGELEEFLKKSLKN